MVKMFKRGEKLYIEYPAYGKKVQKSTRLEDNAKNRTFVKKEIIPAMEAKIRNGNFSQEKPQKFSYYAKRFLVKKENKKTYKKICSYIEILNDTFGNKSIDKIKISDIDDFVEIRKKSNCSKTIRNYLSAMSGVFKEAIKAEVVTQNKALGIELDEHTPEEIEPFSAVEVEKLLKNANGSLKLFIAIGFYTGLRTGEILALTKDDINLEEREITVNKTIVDGVLRSPKTKASTRRVPILDDLFPYVENIIEEGFLFPKKDKSHYSNFPGHYKYAWDTLLKKCSISYRKIYGTRHTFIVGMIKNSGMSILEVAQMAGHTSIQMIVKHYAKFIKNENMKMNKSVKLFTDSTADNAA